MYEPPKLTGRTRHRTGWLGNWILQIEEEISVIDATIRLQPGLNRMRRMLQWRDAKIQDVIAMRDAGIVL